MTTLRPHIQRPRLGHLGGCATAATAPYERLARDLRGKLGRDGALRACRANGWAGALTVLLAEEVSDKAAA